MWKDLVFDTRLLVGGKQFLVNITLARNGLCIKTIAHIDGGANIFGAVKTSTAQQLSKLFQVPVLTLPKPIVPNGYDGKSGKPITSVILLTLTIDRRRINFPFLVTDLGSTDVLIGRKFMEHYDLKTDFKKGKNRIEWPEDMPVQMYYDKPIQMYLRDGPQAGLGAGHSKSHQEDARRRDALMEEESLKPSIDNVDVPPTSPPRCPSKKPSRKSPQSRLSCFVRDLHQSLQKMEKYLSTSTPFSPHSTRDPSTGVDTTPEELPPVKRLRKEHQPYKVNISLISACAMHAIHITKDRKRRRTPNERKDVREDEMFITSVHEIDAEISRRTQEVEIAALGVDENMTPEEAREAKYQSNEDLVKERLPDQYKEFEDLFSKRASDKLPQHKPTVDHKIELDAENNLSFEPLRRMTEDQLSETKRYILENLHKGFIAPSNAPYAAPILFVKKADGSMRLCVDYRKLNELTKKDPYPIPLIDEMMARISKAKIFTKLDIQQAFHRVRMTTDSEDYTTFRTRYGTYKYKVLPFGLTNGPATFQRFINEILLEHLDDFCSAYMDDILIYSDSPEEHEAHVKKIMTILKQHGLQVDINKSEFSVTKTKFLGFIIGVDGIEVDPEKISVINDWDYADNVRGVQSYLGFCNFYRRFIRNYSSICRPLTVLTGKDVPFHFGKQCKEAWEQLREALKSAPILCHYDPFKQTRLETDASDGVVAGVLSQLQDDDLFHPIGYFSKTMIDAELNYPIYDKEMLAIFKSFKQYKPELLGAQKVVHVYTDHKALEYFMTTKDLTARQARWAEFFAEFHFTVMYRTGITNTLADTLSRRDQDISPIEARKRALRKQQMIPDDKIDPRILEEMNQGTTEINALDGSLEDVDSYVTIQLSPVEIEPGPQPDPQPEVAPEMARQTDATPEPSPQVEDGPEAQGHLTLDGEAPDPASEVAYDIDGYNIIDEVISANKDSPSLELLREKARAKHPDYELSHGKLYYQGRLEVPMDPPELRTSLIRHVHAQPCVAHAGISKTRLLLGRKYHWVALGNDVAQYISNCSCVRMKARRDKTPGLLHPLPIPARPYQHLTMDFTELPMDEAGFDAALVIMCRLSKKPVSIPCHKTIDAKGLATLFLVHWERHFGMPDSIVSDRGPQFISSFWREHCRILGTKVKLTTAYNASVDGQTEIMNQYMKQRLRPFCKYYQDNWSPLLPLMDIAQLTLPHESLGNISPFQVLNGTEPRTSFDWHNPTPPATATEKLNQEEALQVATRMHDVIEFAQSSLAVQQEKMKRMADRTRREVDWDVGDMVMVDTRNWRMDRPSRKLSDKWYGPVEVLEKVGESWKIKLPEDWKKYPVFHAHSLRKFVSNPLPGQAREPPAPIQLLPEQEEWEIQEIIGSKIVNSSLKYRIKWTGADEDLEWYPCSDAMTAPHMVKEFHLKYPDAKGPPRALQQWLDAYNAGIDDYTHLDDNRPMTQTARTQFFRGGG